MRSPHVPNFSLLLFFLFPSCCNLLAQREPVLKQIDLPHSYYYREMYLPQLTSGPSAAAWMPDSQTMVYSMQGFLWRQKLDSATAEQLTNGPGYDYQPDVSPDGKLVVYPKYDHDAIELWLLDLSTGQSGPLTKDSAVDLEPHWSPDGKRIAYVSTVLNKHFHIFIFDFEEWQNHNLHNAPLDHPVMQRLTGETRSSLPRYYYSPYDQEISPAWSPDGKEIIFVANHGHIHGTGGFWRMKSQPNLVQPAGPGVPRGPFGMMARNAQPVAKEESREIHYEETTWKARPDWSPDGKRVVYASYLGRQWHQLWLMTPEGGDVFPLAYGDYDNTNPRWSPDGKRIAFISNRDGDTSLWIQDVLSGAQQKVRIAVRKYRAPMRKLQLTISNESGLSTSARVAITGNNGRAYAPDKTWIAADNSFARNERPFEAHYFDVKGTTAIAIPDDSSVQIEVMKGFEYAVEQHSSNSPQFRLHRLKFRQPDAIPWVSGDVHVHMNYGGIYRATPKTLIAQMEAEDLGVVQNLIVNKEQRFPDIEFAARIGKIDPASTTTRQILHGQEFHSSYWGHLGLLNTKHLILPGYAGYPNTPAASIYPMNAQVADMAHAQGKDVLVGYVHPFDEVPDPAKDAKLTNELPVDVALGKVDYYEVLGFSDHKSSVGVWYKLLNLGFRIPAAAGTDAMTNYASLRGPVGLNRVYVQVPSGPLKMDRWLDGIKHGKTFATNGPLLRFSLAGQAVGGDVKLIKPQTVKFTAALRSIVPVDHLEVVCNGEVAVSIPLTGKRDSADASGGIYLPRSGWCVLRAWSEKAEYPILDTYPYATTSPIYVTVRSANSISPKDAQYFMAWIDRVIENAKAYTAYNTEAEKQEVSKTLEAGRAVYARLASPQSSGIGHRGSGRTSRR